MKIKSRFLLAMLFLVFLTGCKTPTFVPHPEAINLNNYGSLIKIKMKSATNLQGELIAVDSTQLVVLMISSYRQCVTIPKNQIQSYKLRYARPKHYGWTIPLFGAYSLTHGLLAIIMLPLNIITTTAVTITGENAYRYNKTQLSYKKLSMFARFPQGIPAGVDTANIEGRWTDY